MVQPKRNDSHYSGNPPLASQTTQEIPSRALTLCGVCRNSGCGLRFIWNSLFHSNWKFFSLHVRRLTLKQLLLRSTT